VTPDRPTTVAHSPIDAPAGARVHPPHPGDPDRRGSWRFADDGPAVIVGRRAFRRVAHAGHEQWASCLIDPRPGEWGDWRTATSRDPEWAPEARQTTVYVTIAVEVDPYVSVEDGVEAAERELDYRSWRDAHADALRALHARLPRRGYRFMPQGVTTEAWADVLRRAGIEQ
jgi:hypothetical protein